MNEQLKNALTKLKEYSLSDTDIKKVTNNILTYPYLNNVEHIDEIFDNNGVAILLILSSQNVGHWICVLKYDDTIEWYDGYAFKPNEVFEKLEIPVDVMNELNEDPNKFLNLVDKSGYKFVYNKKRRQSLKQGVNTCGDFALCRSIFRGLNLKQYNEMLDNIIVKNGLNTDDVITLFIHQKLDD